MILKGNARGGAKDLALHLMKDENDHVELHELRGFVSESLMGAFNEVYAQRQGTRCTKFLYSLSINPPETENVTIEDFEDAISRAEERLGLTEQPRAVVFHEKEGRRHAHVVWSRIDAAEMKAVPLPFDREKLMEVSRELFRDHHWRMPEGLADPARRDPRNFTLAEWQQAQRTGRDPRQIKGAIQDAWAISDTKAGLSHALEERGFIRRLAHRARAIEVGRMLEDHGFCHFEEPCPYWELEQTKEVTEALDIDVTGGEQDCDLSVWRHMIDMRAVDIVQPDICYLGGIARTLRVCRMAEAARLPVTPHCANLSMVTLFTMHLLRAIPNAGKYLEFSIEGPDYYPWQEGLFVESPYSIENGHATVTDASGWGVEIAPEWLARAQYQRSDAG